MGLDRDSTLNENALGWVSGAELDELCQQHRVRRLDLFGSTAGEKFDTNHSDLDFIVTFEPMSPAEYAAAYFSLREALERLSGRSIDLLTEAALTNPYLRRSVDAQRYALFART